MDDSVGGLVGSVEKGDEGEEGVEVSLRNEEKARGRSKEKVESSTHLAVAGDPDRLPTLRARVRAKLLAVEGDSEGVGRVEVSASAEADRGLQRKRKEKQRC